MVGRGGVDLGGTKIQVVVVDGRDSVRGDARRPTPTTGGPEAVAEAIAGAVAEAAEAAGIEPRELTGVGVGSPGAVDAEAGTVTGAGNLPDWAGTYPLGPALKERLGAPVLLGNDVSVATQAELALGAGRPYRSLLGVFWGTGVGGGVVIEGQQWVGRGAAGEIGHVVIERDGRLCPCGRRGCMEAYAGRKAMELRARELVEQGEKTDLFRIMEKRGRDRLTAGIWNRALKRDDELARGLLDEAVEALGAGIASALNVLDVEAVILGGGMGLKLGEPYARRIEEAMLPHLFTSDRPPPVHLAELGDLGGAIGATLLAAEGSRKGEPVPA